MYPYLRAIYHWEKAKRQPKLDHPFQEIKYQMRVMPWDIDIFMELNNGRYLTLMDIGRYIAGVRTGLFQVMKKNKWGTMVGAVNARFRHRLKPFQKFTIHTKLIYLDDRWFYFHQWFTTKGGKVHASFLVRTAVYSKDGLISSDEVSKAMKIPIESIEKYNKPSEWITSWAESDDFHKIIMEEQL